MFPGTRRRGNTPWGSNFWKPEGVWQKYHNTPRSIIRRIEKVRKRGYAVDDEEYHEGVQCIAAPIRAGGEVVANLSITGSIFTMTMERIKGELRELVMRTAEKISSEMRW